MNLNKSCPESKIDVPVARPRSMMEVRWLVLAMCIGLVLSHTSSAIAQQPPTSDSDILSEELLKDIVPMDAAESSDPDNSTDKGDAGGNRSFGASDNPFEVISLGMWTASKYLREGETGTTTQDVQSNVLMRLDELIEQAEKQSKKPKSSSDSSSSQPKTKLKTKREKSQSPKSENKQRSDQRNKSEGGQESPEDKGDQPQTPPKNEDNDTQPGNPEGNGSQASDDSRKSNLELGNAKVLQQGVWGHLPERIRQQMMSRMVERFLPEYEASIEEYFRKLSDAEEDPEKP